MTHFFVRPLRDLRCSDGYGSMFDGYGSAKMLLKKCIVKIVQGRMFDSLSKYLDVFCTVKILARCFSHKKIDCFFLSNIYFLFIKNLK